MLVSVIIPVFNGEKTIERAVRSVLNQSYKSIEIIVIDDCSTDCTNLLVDKLSEENTRIHHVRLNKNTGSPSYPRNLGIDIAKGEYIAFLDADDYWEATKVEMQINSGHDFSYCNYFRITTNGRKKIKSLFSKATYWTLIFHNTIGLSTVLIRKKLVENIRFKNVCNEDLFFYLDILKSGKIAFLTDKERFLSNYQVTNNGRSASKVKINICRMINLIKLEKLYFLSFIAFFTHIILASIRNIIK